MVVNSIKAHKAFKRSVVPVLTVVAVGSVIWGVFNLKSAENSADLRRAETAQGINLKIKMRSDFESVLLPLTKAITFGSVNYPEGIVDNRFPEEGAFLVYDVSNKEEFGSTITNPVYESFLDWVEDVGYDTEGQLPEAVFLIEKDGMKFKVTEVADIAQIKSKYLKALVEDTAWVENKPEEDVAPSLNSP